MNVPVQNEEDAYRKMRLRVEDVQGRNCLTHFWVSATSLVGGPLGMWRDMSGMAGRVAWRLPWTDGWQKALCAVVRVVFV